MPDAEKQDKQTKKKPLSRREVLKKERAMLEYEELEMPECAAPHIVSYLFELGPVVSTGMGQGPISHTEIEAWQRNTGIELDSWESRTLRTLSNDYAAEASKATERDCPAPWQAAPYAVAPENLVAERMKRETRELANL